MGVLLYCAGEVKAGRVAAARALPCHDMKMIRMGHIGVTDFDVSP